MLEARQKQDEDPTPPGADVPVGETGRKYVSKMILGNQIHDNTKMSGWCGRCLFYYFLIET